MSFADAHGSGTDRAGDIFCRVLGSSSSLSVQFPTIAAQFSGAGLDCVAEYPNQFDKKLSAADEDGIAALDRLIAEHLKSISLWEQASRDEAPSAPDQRNRYRKKILALEEGEVTGAFIEDSLREEGCSWT